MSLRDQIRFFAPNHLGEELAVTDEASKWKHRGARKLRKDDDQELFNTKCKPALLFPSTMLFQQRLAVRAVLPSLGKKVLHMTHASTLGSQ